MMRSQPGRLVSAFCSIVLAHVASPLYADDLGAQTQAATESASLQFFPTPYHFSRARHLFENETFGGNGRTCLTCHSRSTGTLSPEDAGRRFARDPKDPLFLADGSDDGNGSGTTRILADATILVRIALPDNVALANDPAARSVVLRRGVPSTPSRPVT